VVTTVSVIYSTVYSVVGVKIYALDVIVVIVPVVVNKKLLNHQFFNKINLIPNKIQLKP
jgi:hypothetical protein